MALSDRVKLKVEKKLVTSKLSWKNKMAEEIKWKPLKIFFINF